MRLSGRGRSGRTLRIDRDYGQWWRVVKPWEVWAYVTRRRDNAWQFSPTGGKGGGGAGSKGRGAECGDLHHGDILKDVRGVSCKS